MGFFSGGKSYQNSESFSGLRVKKGTGDDNTAFNSLLYRTPGDLNFTVDALKARTQDTNPFQLNSQGFMASQMEGVNQFGKNMFNDVSSNYAGRGFLAPENVAGVIGSAVTNASPQLMQQIYQNQAGNQAVQSDRFNQLNQALSLYSGLLGGQSQSQGTTTSNGIGFNFANQLGSNLAQWANPSTFSPGGGKGVLS